MISIDHVSNEIFLFIYRLCWVFVAAGLSLAVAVGGSSLLGCMGFSLWSLLWWWSMGSRAHRRQPLWLFVSGVKVHSCGAGTLPCGM